jgi:23S rRNA (adenine2503-C2)-methyltransferase
MHSSSHPRALFGLTQAELSTVVEEMGEPAYRAGQIAQALYRDRVAEVGSITTLPAALRESLGANWKVGLPKIVQSFSSVDGTERYLVETGSGETVETVWMPSGDCGEEGDGSAAGAEEENSAPVPATICVSSQIGCAVNCQFCFTAKLGERRNLTAGEIAGQVIAVLNRQQVDLDRTRINLVFMGMGEPFLNYDAFMTAVRLLVEEVGVPESRMTVSTSGIVPGILKFAEEPVRPKLAISLNAPNDSVRSEVMPINRKWPIAELINAVGKVPLRPRERITFEYVLLGGVTDLPAQADELARLVRRANIPAKVNLIAWNSGPGIAFATPDDNAVREFRERLVRAGIHAFVRRPRGRDIYAACGQLKRTVQISTDLQR